MKKIAAAIIAISTATSCLSTAEKAPTCCSSPSRPLPAKAKSLYERIGGQAAIDAVVDTFYVKLLADNSISPFFEEVNINKQIRRQKEFLAAAFGGPKYQGRSLKSAHRGEGITEAHFNTVASHLVSSLREHQVPEGIIAEIVAIAQSVKSQVVEK